MIGFGKKVTKPSLWILQRNSGKYLRRHIPRTRSSKTFKKLPTDPSSTKNKNMCRWNNPNPLCEDLPNNQLSKKYNGILYSKVCEQECTVLVVGNGKIMNPERKLLYLATENTPNVANAQGLETS